MSVKRKFDCGAYIASFSALTGGNVRICAGGQFDCGNFTCIAQWKVCDGITNCKNGEDEVNCPTRSKFLQKSGMSVGIMFAVIGSSIESFFKFGMVNMKVIRNKKTYLES